MTQSTLERRNRVEMTQSTLQRRSKTHLPSAFSLDGAIALNRPKKKPRHPAEARLAAPKGDRHGGRETHLNAIRSVAK
jgi:hypothetical protein